jgi:Flp pilus assembly protein TadG
MKTGGTLSIENRKGQALVETALVISLFMALLFGIIEFGRAWFYSNHLNNSVRAAARYGAVLGSSSDLPSSVDSYLTSEISAYIPPDGIQNITVQVLDKTTNAPKNASDASHGDTLDVAVVYDFQVIPGTIIPNFNGSVPIRRSASMLIE